MALLWMNEAKVEVASFSNMHIDAKIGEGSQGNTWRFIGFYGSPDVNQRGRSWDMMRLLYDQNLHLGFVQEISMRFSMMKRRWEGLQEMPDKWRIFDRCYMIATCKLYLL